MEILSTHKTLYLIKSCNYLNELLIIQAIKAPVKPGNLPNVCMTKNG